MATKVLTSEEVVQIDLDKATLAKLAQAFREALRPFGLDHFMLSDAPAGILSLENGRVLAEFRTMLLPVWYQEKLMQLKAAGFEVVTVTKRYKTRPSQEMYYVRSVQEIGGNYGNQ